MKEEIMKQPEWKSISEAPFGEIVMARNSEFGPYEYDTGDFVFMDPPPEEFMTMNDFNDWVSK